MAQPVLTETLLTRIADLERRLTTLERTPRVPQVTTFEASASEGLGVARGYLGLAIPTAPPVALGGAMADIPGMSVPFDVPAGRRLKVTAYVKITNQDASPRASFIQVLDENDTNLFNDSASHDNFGGSLGPGRTLNAVSFQLPTAGAHTYRLQASINGAAGALVAGSFLSVEDVGPAS